MSHKHLSLFVCILSTLICFTGCKPIAIDSFTKDEAHEKFLKIIGEEYKTTIITKLVGDSLWIYLPREHEILGLKGKPDGPKHSSNFTEGFHLAYINTSFHEYNFTVKYDITPVRAYEEDLGYTSYYHEQFTNQQSNIFTALQRAYFETEEPPRFIALVISDIKNGIEIESIIYFDDFKKTYSNAPSISHDEYAKRVITEVRGDGRIIGDQEGQHLDYREISMGEFLSKQIKNRVNFKFQHSDFKPEEHADQEILRAVRNTLTAYAFSDFDSVVINDLSYEESKRYSRKELFKKR